MLGEFGHPNLDDVVEAIYKAEPNYEHLSEATRHVAADASRFERNRSLLTEAGLSPQATQLLELACGPLATQSLLLNSIGYATTGADLTIPPDGLPLTSFAQRFKKGKYVKAWQTATKPYYDQLARAANVSLNWKNLTIKLADLTRLDLPANQFDAVLCANYLQHAPDVDALLAEAARVLKNGGFFLADIVPYSYAFGALQAGDAWGHLRSGSAKPVKVDGVTKILNKWPIAAYRAAIEKTFSIEQWQVEQDETVSAKLTPALRSELADYDEAELMTKSIVVLARKK
jgi:SAM-dependent methyltransferase